MSVSHPWLEETPWPTRQLSIEQLEQKIERIISLTNIGYLGTVRKDGSPIVSPVEFYADHLSIYIFPQPNSPKVKALQRDPRVSFAVANPMAGSIRPRPPGISRSNGEMIPTSSRLSVAGPEWPVCGPDSRIVFRRTGRRNGIP